ncbi:hypothetical protein ADL22_17950 [Streptomyces sp. NRRL F-4489]|nr:hypothetical protein ADL22_17950 [Streptomyces sp. NRRL F-4489]
MQLPEGGERGSRGWVAPLVSSVATVVAGVFALGVLGFSAMACDACNGGKAHEFDASLVMAMTVLKVGFLAPAGMLAVAWGSGEPRHAGRRAILALMAPLAVVVLFVLCMAMVDWP